MNLVRFSAAFGQAAALWLAFIAFMPESQAAAPPDIARMAGLSDTVKIVRDRRTLEAKRGDGLQEGDQITTGKGNAVMVFSDRSVFILAPQSTLLLSAHGLTSEGKETVVQSLAHLVRGRVLIDAKKSDYRRDMRVKVRSYVLGIRGTRLAASEAPEKASIVVLEGRVTVGNGTGSLSQPKSRDGPEVTAGMQGSLLVPLTDFKSSAVSPKELRLYEAAFIARPPGAMPDAEAAKSLPALVVKGPTAKPAAPLLSLTGDDTPAEEPIPSALPLVAPRSIVAKLASSGLYAWRLNFPDGWKSGFALDWQPYLTLGPIILSVQGGGGAFRGDGGTIWPLWKAAASVGVIAGRVIPEVGAGYVWVRDYGDKAVQLNGALGFNLSKGTSVNALQIIGSKWAMTEGSAWGYGVGFRFTL